MLLCIVVPEAALGTANLVSEALHQTGKTTTYVDCNAVAPETGKATGEVITSAGSRTIDVGIIGSPQRQPGITR